MTTARPLPPCTTAATAADLAADKTTVATFDRVTLEDGDGGCRGEGTLTCTSSRLIWLPADGAPGLAVAVPSVALHAVSTDRDGPPCVVALLDDGRDVDENGGEDEEDAEDPTTTTTPSPELRFIPTPPTTADAIFTALCECAALNPDPTLAAEDADGAGDWLTDADAVAAAAGGRDPLASLPADALDALVASQAARFEDAD